MKKYILHFKTGSTGFGIEITDTKKSPITPILSGVTEVELSERNGGKVLWKLVK